MSSYVRARGAPPDPSLLCLYRLHVEFLIRLLTNTFPITGSTGWLLNVVRQNFLETLLKKNPLLVSLRKWCPFFVFVCFSGRHFT